MPSYRQRAMHCRHKWYRRSWMPPKSTYRGGPLLNKPPEEYSQTWDWRYGHQWRDRILKRGAYVKWPWVTIHDDPIGDALRKASRGALSPALQREAGQLTFDPFHAVGRDYMTPSDVALPNTVPFLLPHISRIWKESQVRAYIDLIVAASWDTPRKVAAAETELRQWNDANAAVPRHFLDYLVMLSKDMVNLDAKKAFRCERQEQGDLRTNDMVRYYALPYTVGPAMPTTLAQPEGRKCAKPFSEMYKLGLTLHPAVIQAVDRLGKKGSMPA